MFNRLKIIWTTLLLVGAVSCGGDSGSELAGNKQQGKKAQAGKKQANNKGNKKGNKKAHNKGNKKANNKGNKKVKKIKLNARVKKLKKKKKGTKLALSGFQLANTTGETRNTPYQSEQSGQGTCGNFRDVDSDSKKWAAISEPLAKAYFGFPGCESHGTEKPPSCQSQANSVNLCGKTLKIKCTSDKCADKGWKEVKVVDICPADRTYHNIHDPGSDGVCAHMNIVDIDESLWNSIKQPHLGIENVPIEIEIP